MALNKREKIIAVVMALVVCLWLAQFLFPSKQKKKAASAPTKASGGQTLAANATAGPRPTEKPESLNIAQLEQLVKQKTRVIEPAQIHDPFKKPEPKATALGASGLVLSGVIWEGENSMVVVNDKILGPGDAIDEFIVDEIHSDRVLLRKGGQRHILRLFTREEALQEETNN